MTRMDSGFIEDFLTICEGKFPRDEIANLHDGLNNLKRQERREATKNKENVILNLITRAVQRQDKKMKEKQSKPQSLLMAQSQPIPSAPKEETEAVMEGLMNRIVANPNLIVDETLNSRIENIFNCNAFQKMVEHAEVYPQGLSNASGISHDGSGLNLTGDGMPTGKKKEEVSRDDSPCFGPQQIEVRGAPPAASGGAFGTRKGTFAPATQSDIYVPPSEGSEEQHTPGQEAKKRELSQTPSVKQLIPQVDKEEDEEESKEEKSLSKNFIDELDQNAAPQGEPVERIIPEGDKSLSVINPNENSRDTTNFPDDLFPIGPSIGQQKYMEMPEHQRETQDEYIDDNDEGFIVREATEDDFVRLCKELAKKYNFPDRAILPKDSKIRDDSLEDKKHEEIKMETEEERAARELAAAAQAAIKNDESAAMLKTIQDGDKKEPEQEKRISLLPNWVKFPPTKENDFYPVEFDGVIYDCYQLRVIYDREKTGFEQTKDFQIVINSIVAGRYQVMEYLGSAAFSKAIQCQDLLTKQHVCMKIIENNKDYLDQSLDEIKLLRFINVNCENPDEKNVLRLFDYFYHKEHLFIVTELLRDNLYEFYRFNRDNEDKPYFTIGRLQKITQQILIALEYIHSLHLIHCDLKPENILIKSYSKCQVKVIDFGSSCFIHDHLSSYVQSRSYRAPEVILGCKYDYKIDMWSLGCILAELFTGYVLFQNESIQALLARVLGIIGPIPEHMMMEGQLVPNYFTRQGLIYQEGADDDYSSNDQSADSSVRYSKRKKDLNQTFKIHLLIPKRTTLKSRLNNTEDYLFLDFIFQLLQIDPAKRPSASEAMKHPWLTAGTYDEGI